METGEAARRRVVDALRQAGGNRVRAAELLGVGRATLYRWIERYGLDDSIPAQIGRRYEVRRRLGSGSDADVFLVADLARGRGLFALKRLRDAPDHASRARIDAEFRALSLLRHPALVRVHDVGEEPGSGRPFLVMDVVDGAPFAVAARDRPPGIVLGWFAELLGAVDALHRHGLVHRDIKSENVLVCADSGRVTLMDLGLAEDLSRAARAPAGTLLALAPEIAEGGRASPRSDLYALGVMLYHALSGRYPFAGEAPAQTLAAQRSGVIEPVYGPVDPLLSRLLAADPQARPADAAAVLEDLERRIHGRRPVPTVMPSFVGRQEDLEALAGALLPEAAGAPVVVVTGEPGVGKSRMLEAVLDELRVRGVRVARGTCRPGPGRGLEPLAELAREALRAADGSGATAEDMIARDHAPALAAMADGADLPRQAAIEAVGDLFAALARAVPLVLGLEDLHVADPFVLETLVALARRARAGAPLRVAATARPPGPTTAFASTLRAANAESLSSTYELGPLDAEAMRALATAALGPARAAEVSERLLRITGGNPFFALAVLAETASRGDDALRVPEAAQAAVRARIATAGRREAAFLAALALAGRPAHAAELDAVASSVETPIPVAEPPRGPRAAPEGAEGVVGALIARGLVAAGPGGRLEFGHAVLREAVLSGIDPDLRRSLNRGWARAATDPVERAMHSLAAGETDHALFLAAAERLERAYQHGAALDLLDAIRVDLPADDARLGPLFARMERDAKAARDVPRATEVCRAWAAFAARAGDLAGESRARALYAARQRDVGAFEPACESAREALSIAERTGDQVSIAFAEKVLSTVLWNGWEHAAAKDQLERTLARCRAVGDRRGAAEALFDLVFARPLAGFVQSGLDAAREVEAIYEDLGEPARAAYARSNLALVLTWLGDLEGAGRLLRGVIADVRALGADVPLEEVRENLLAVLLRQGRYSEALAATDDLLEDALRHGRQRFRVSALLLRAEALHALDERAAARDHARLAEELAAAHGEAAQLAFAQIARARDLRLDGRPVPAAQAAEAAHASAVARRALRVRAAAALERARIAREQDDAATAHRWLDDAEEALVVPREDGQAQRAALLGERARLRCREQAFDLARADIDEALGQVSRAGPVDLEIRLHALAAEIADSRGDTTMAVSRLQHAARRIEAVAALEPDPARRARYLGRPDLAAVLTAARRRGTSTPTPVPGRDEAVASLYEIGRHVADGGDIGALLDRIVDLAVERSGAERGLLLLYDPVDGTLRSAASKGTEAQTERDAVDLSRSVLGAAERGRAVLARDVHAHPELAQAASVALFGIRSVMCVPLRAGDEVLGTLYVDSRAQSASFGATDLRFLEALADQAAVALAYARLVERLARERNALQEVARERHGFGQLVGRAPSMRRAFALLERVAPTDLSVVICGASGTGKELAARALHFNSPRRERPFLSENCAALPETLLESLLFGHVRGAFTGADRDRAGLFAQADGGTLFLDEIGDMSAPLQAKLLRVLQEREVRPLGGDRAVSVDVRIVAATHSDLPDLVARGRFRDDLYFRINGITITLPALAERREDIPLLFRHFVERECARDGRPVPEIAPGLARVLCAHDWPGNVRELENVARRALVFAEGGVLDAASVAHDPALAAIAARIAPLPRDAGQPAAADAAAPARGSANPALPEAPSPADAPAIALRRALEAAAGDPTRAAEILGISRATLYRRLREHGITRR